jgi:hypothetical protein
LLTYLAGRFVGAKKGDLELHKTASIVMLRKTGKSVNKIYADNGEIFYELT